MIFGISQATAINIVARMVGQSVEIVDQLAAFAIAELGNMISGHVMTLLANQGYTCDITPPTVIKGTNVRIETLNIPALVIPMTIETTSDLEINVSVQERKQAVAA